MYNERVKSLLDQMTWGERLDFDRDIMARFTGTEHADAWHFRKLLERARENDNNKGK